MKSFYLKTSLVIIGTIISFGAWFPLTSSAAGCSVVSATLDPSSDQDSFDSEEFYSEATHDSKIVSITVTTSGCASTQTVFVSLGQFNNIQGYAGNIPALNKKPIYSTSDTFTIKLSPGENLCSNIAAVIDCKYAVLVGTDINNPSHINYNSRDKIHGNLDYECDGACFGDWKYKGVVYAPNPDPNTVPVTGDGKFSTGVDATCADPGGDCYELFSGFADALGSGGNGLGGKIGSIAASDNLGEFLNKIIAFGIGIGGVLAVAMIMYEGFLYMKTDNTDTKTTAKSRILNTVVGFILLLCIYTILRTINPDLLNLMPRIDSSTLNSIVDHSQDTDFQENAVELGGTGVPVDSSDYSDLTFIAYLYHQQGPGGAPSILWAAKKGYSTIPSTTPFIKGNAAQVNKNMANNLPKADMQKVLGTSDVTPTNFLKYWRIKVGAAQQSTKPIPQNVLQAVTQASTDTGVSLDTMKAVCRIESSCKPPNADKCNAFGYCGLFQVSNGVFKDFGKGGSILDYYSNAYTGGKYAKYNMNRYNNNKSKINEYQ